jgi:dihydrolipoamide dehydrogenase
VEAAEYDLIVIGAGAVGENVADRAVQGGLSVVIVESELVGGECSYWACMPSKTLLRAGAALRGAREAPGAAEVVSGGVDALAALRRRDAVVHDWDDSSQVSWLDKTGIALVRGHGEITGVREVTVGDRVLRGRHAVAVCTGSAALLPDVPGIAEAGLWTSREATSAHEVPASLVVIGGGVVACEMATAFASFGTAVTMIVRSAPLKGYEPFVSDRVAAGLRALGVEVRTGVEVARVERDGDVLVTLDDGSTVRAAEGLVATGRVPRTQGLGLASVGVDASGWLDVDDTLLVRGTDWLYAVGDVNGRVLLTHEGKYQARAAGDVIAARARGRDVDTAPWGTHVATADHAATPLVIFTEPQVASVGLTAARAEADGIRVRTLDYDLSWVAGATTYSDSYEGTARAVVDDDRGVLVGATFVGQDVAELLHAATIAIVGEVPLSRLWHAVPPYPTLSEVWLRWLEEYGRPGDPR